MNFPDCELSILVARPDTGYMMQTVSHLVRACNYPFARKVLIVDTAPLGERYRNRQDLPSMSAFFDCCLELIKKGVMDQQICIDYDAQVKREIYEKHFGCDIKATSSHRNCPIFGFLFTIEKARSPYLVHFDSDMLLHQDADFNWIKRGIELLQKDERIFSVMPLSGPPSPDGPCELVSYEHNQDGFFEFKFFSTRVYLIDVRRFQTLLPLSLLFHEPPVVPIKHFLSEIALTTTAVTEEKLETWEKMINARIANTSFVRANLDDERAWTLHALDHGPEFIAKLPGIIQKVESGLFPVQQAGHYDLELSFWTEEYMLHKRLDQFQYSNADDLWIICCYFNAANYKSMPKKYALFEKSLQDSGLNFIAVECAFDGQPFSLRPGENVVQVRSNSVLWQKERLLNLAISKLPQICKKVAWLDTDIFFLNRDWAVEASQLLEEYPVVQLFGQAVVTEPRAQYCTGKEGSYNSFGYVLNEKQESFNQDVYDEHGHTGYGWACRREILEKHGLYDRLIIGSADHAMAHAMLGNFSSPCLDRDLGDDSRQIEPFREWAKLLHEQIRSEIGCVSGTVVHYWHGTRENRRHGVRHDELSQCGFDPRTDLRLNDQGCWEWNTDKPKLHALLRDYFGARREDD